MPSSLFDAYSECKGLSPTRLSVGTCLVWTAFLAVTGCVEESRYQAVTAEVEQVKADVERMQAEAKALEQQVALLRALNHQEEAPLTELLTELQNKNDAATRRQQEYEDRVAALQAKANTLLSQNRTLMREMREAKKQETSLLALVTRYEKELQLSESALENVTAPPLLIPDPSSSPGPATQPPQATSPPQETLASAPAPQPQPPPQTQTPAPAQTAPPPPPPQQQPAMGESDESWWSTIMDWLSTAWNWFFS
jgi:outer membrane murein-binding lipoprotein Lpp